MFLNVFGNMFLKASFDKRTRKKRFCLTFEKKTLFAKVKSFFENVFCKKSCSKTKRVKKVSKMCQ